MLGRGRLGHRRAKQFVETTQRMDALFYIFILFAALRVVMVSQMCTYVLLLNRMLRNSLIHQLHFNKAILEGSKRNRQINPRKVAVSHGTVRLRMF